MSAEPTNLSLNLNCRSFTLPSSLFSVRVQVRFCRSGFWVRVRFGVRGSDFVVQVLGSTFGALAIRRSRARRAFRSASGDWRYPSAGNLLQRSLGERVRVEALGFGDVPLSTASRRWFCDSIRDDRAMTPETGRSPAGLNRPKPSATWAARTARRAARADLDGSSPVRAAAPRRVGTTAFL